jgi:hypothetical protein
MTDELLRPQRLALQKAWNVDFPFAVTGFLLDPVIVDTMAVGWIYRHVKADPLTRRFADGNLIHTSYVVGFVEHAGFVVLITRNSAYVCVVGDVEKLILMRGIEALPKQTYH